MADSWSEIPWLSEGAPHWLQGCLVRFAVPVAAALERRSLPESRESCDNPALN